MGFGGVSEIITVPKLYSMAERGKTTSLKKRALASEKYLHCERLPSGKAASSSIKALTTTVRDDISSVLQWLGHCVTHENVTFF